MPKRLVYLPDPTLKFYKKPGSSHIFCDGDFYRSDVIPLNEFAEIIGDEANKALIYLSGMKMSGTYFRAFVYRYELFDVLDIGD